MTTLTRRQFLRAIALLATGAGASGCADMRSRALGRIAGSPTLPDAPMQANTQLFRALSRMTFGPRADEIACAQSTGLAGWIEEQLAPSTIDDLGVSIRLSGFDTLAMSAGDIIDWSSQLFDDIDKDAPVTELRSATLLRQIYSRRQLYEVMVDFWSDHFNIFAAKGQCWAFKTVDDREVIRPHALGRFGDLLRASARSPAMLEYLDNHSNHADRPNENYARELLELHTLGVNGGYTQSDVMELARGLTGWRWREDGFRHGEFAFDATVHDFGEKSILSARINASGENEVEGVLERLTTHPSTARHLALKLAQRFLGATPPVDIVTRAATAYANSHGAIQAMLRPILLDGLAHATPIFKRPAHFLGSALRALHADTDGGRPVLDALERMGQLPFAWPTPDGYPRHDAAWQNNLLPRWQFALALADNTLGNTRIDWPALERWLAAPSPASQFDALATLLLGAPLDAPVRDSLLHALGDSPSLQIQSAALIAAPQFQWQ